MSNLNDGGSNGYYTRICGDLSPDRKWKCSLSADHRGDKHKAYAGHRNTHRTQWRSEWAVDGKTKTRSGKVNDDDVAAALASIQATMQDRLPSKVVAERISELGDVTVQTRAQNAVAEELDRIIEDLTRLRSSLS